MSDDLNAFKPLDPGRVNPLDPVELRYWCRELGCTEAQLLAAIGAVGEHVSAIRAHLAAGGARPAPRRA